MQTGEIFIFISDDDTAKYARISQFWAHAKIIEKGVIVPASLLHADNYEFPEKSVKKFLEDRKYIGIYWIHQDIVNHALNNDVVLTDDQVEIAAEYLKDNFDANEGINWTAIDEAISFAIE